MTCCAIANVHTCWLLLFLQLLFVAVCANASSVSNQCNVGQQLNTQPCFIAGLPSNVTSKVGDSAELLCGVQEIGQRTVYWWKDGDDHPLTVGLQRFLSGRRISVLHKSAVYWNLKIDRVALRDAGLYICKVSTTPTMQRAVILHVLPDGNGNHMGNSSGAAQQHEYDGFVEYQQSAPTTNADTTEHVTPLGPDSVTVTISNRSPIPHFVDDRLFLECNVTVGAALNRSLNALNASLYRCDIDWFHNSNVMYSDRRKDVLITLKPSFVSCRNLHSLVSTLAITRLKAQHSGKYFCNFKVLPHREFVQLRSDSASGLLIQKESAIVNVHVRMRNASASVQTAPLQATGMYSRAPQLRLSMLLRLSSLCLLTFLTLATSLTL